MPHVIPFSRGCSVPVRYLWRVAPEIQRQIKIVGKTQTECSCGSTML